jgi:hypothetical protein
MTRAMAIAAAGCMLQACSVTLPVKGQLQNSTETFPGTATGYADRSSVLSITSNAGAICIGDFAYTSSRRAKAYSLVVTGGPGRSSSCPPVCVELGTAT